MSKKIVNGIAVLIMLMLVVSACAPASPAAPTAAAKATQPPTAAPTSSSGSQKTTTQASSSSGVTLKITGLVESELILAEDKVKAMKTTSVESKNNKGETATYTGVLLSDLLNQAKPKANAASVVFIAEDGTSAKAPLADVVKCTNCILSFRSNGGFSSVLPSFDAKLQVKGVVEIQVKE